MKNTDLILSKFGLQTRKTPADYLVPALGILGTGALVGAGVALMLAPKSGKELRSDIGHGVKRVGNGARSVGSSIGTGVRSGISRIRSVMPGNGANARIRDDLSRDELYEIAQEMEIPGRSSMNRDELLEALRLAAS